MVYFFDEQIKEERDKYKGLLKVIAKLSGLFSDSESPYIYYRAMENIFCKSFRADNLSRSDISIDACKNRLGIGLKTFLEGNGKTFQKVAEFNKQAYLLRDLNINEVVLKVATMRNERIESTIRICDLKNAIYHLLTRNKGKLTIYEENMDLIDIHNIKNIEDSPSSVQFYDGKNEYSFNKSKSTLLKRFETINQKAIDYIDVNIIEDPYNILLDLIANDRIIEKNKKEEYIILPLYSSRSGKVEKHSGLNQWNANGRRRDLDEVYIPIPIWIHKYIENFFEYNTEDFKTDTFNVILPNRKVLTMRVAQSGGKALMSNPNRDLGKWLLRDVLRIDEGVLVSKEMLDIIGIDSVRLTKMDKRIYKLDFLKSGSFDEYERSILNRG
jgi:hypothetical protein